jgi:hypothetical protein
LKYEPHQNSRVITGVLERLVHSVYFIINVKENQRGDQEWTIYEVKIPNVSVITFLKYAQSHKIEKPRNPKGLNGKTKIS